MSAPTIKPRSRLGRLATLQRLATALTWVFWLTALVTALELLLALTRSGGIGNQVPNSQGTVECRQRPRMTTPSPSTSTSSSPTGA